LGSLALVANRLFPEVDRLDDVIRRGATILRALRDGRLVADANE
jgi:hypothetical protein